MQINGKDITTLRIEAEEQLLKLESEITKVHALLKAKNTLLHILTSKLKNYDMLQQAENYNPE